MIMSSDPLSRPLIDIARELRDRRASARELVEAAIARHEPFGERVPAYSFWAPNQARGGAAPGTAGLDQGPVRRCRISLLRRIDPAPAGGSLGAGRAACGDAAPPV